MFFHFLLPGFMFFLAFEVVREGSWLWMNASVALEVTAELWVSSIRSLQVFGVHCLAAAEIGHHAAEADVTLGRVLNS
jgi:hypothetical protein